MSAGNLFRSAVEDNHPLQVVGTITALAALIAERAGHKAIYLSGGGLASNSLGVPDLGISTLDDVLIDIRRISDVCELPMLVDVDTGFGNAFNIARTTRSLIKAGAAAMHIEDQVAAKRCGHRPNKEIVSQGEMTDRIKAAVDARTFHPVHDNVVALFDLAYTGANTGNDAGALVAKQVGDVWVRAPPATDLFQLLAADAAGRNFYQNLSHFQFRYGDLRYLKRRILFD